MENEYQLYLGDCLEVMKQLPDAIRDTPVPQIDLFATA